MFIILPSAHGFPVPILPGVRMKHEHLIQNAHKIPRWAQKNV